MTRNKLIDIIKDPNLEVETLDTAMQQYFSLLLGLIYPPKGEPLNNLNGVEWEAFVFHHKSR